MPEPMIVAAMPADTAAAPQAGELVAAEVIESPVAEAGVALGQVAPDEAPRLGHAERLDRLRLWRGRYGRRWRGHGCGRYGGDRNGWDVRSRDEPLPQSRRIRAGDSAQAVLARPPVIVAVKVAWIARVVEEARAHRRHAREVVAVHHVARIRPHRI